MQGVTWITSAWLQAKPDTDTCSPKRSAGTSWLLQPLAGNKTAQACSAIQISGQHVRAGHLCPSLHFWGSSSTSEEQVAQHCRRTEQAERHQSMETGVYVKQMLAHFTGKFERANLDKRARFPGPQDHRIICTRNLYSAGHKLNSCSGVHSNSSEHRPWEPSQTEPQAPQQAWGTLHTWHLMPTVVLIQASALNLIVDRAQLPTAVCRG